MGDFFKMMFAVMVGFFLCTLMSVLCFFLFSLVSGGIIVNQLSNLSIPADSYTLR